MAGEPRRAAEFFPTEAFRKLRTFGPTPRESPRENFGERRAAKNFLEANRFSAIGRKPKLFPAGPQQVCISC